MTPTLARRLAALPDDQLGDVGAALQEAGRRAAAQDKDKEGRPTMTAFEEKVAAAARKMRIGQVGKATRQLAAMIDAGADEAAITAGLHTLVAQGYLVPIGEPTTAGPEGIPSLTRGGLLARAVPTEYVVPEVTADPKTVPHLGERGLFRVPARD